MARAADPDKPKKRTTNVPEGETAATHLFGIHVSVRQRQGRVVLVHDLSGDAAHDARVDVMARRDLFCELADRRVAHGAINILRMCIVTRRQFQSGKTGIHG
jgi:hypothetical protein